MKLAAALVSCVASLAGCNLKRETVTVEPYVPPVRAVDNSPMVTTAPAAPPVPSAVSVTVSGAAFKDEKLIECAESTFEVQRVEGKPFDEEKAEETLYNLMFPKKSVVTRLRSSCASQFKDRQAFAVCTQTMAVGDSGARTITTRDNWYSFDVVFGNDHLMKTCIEHGGSWEAVAQDSSLFRMAKLESDHARLMKQVKRYAPDIDE